MINRRNFINTGVGFAAGLVINRKAALAREAFYPMLKSGAAAKTAAYRYRIGVCDWMIYNRQSLGAFPLARELGVDGVEVDMGQLGNSSTFNNKLLDTDTQNRFKDAAEKNGLEFSSMSMAAFYTQHFAERKGVIEIMVPECMRTMTEMGIGLVYLPLGDVGKGDLVLNPELRTEMVGRVRASAAMAEKAGVIIGIESMFDATDELALLKEIGSPAVKSYYNFANAVRHGKDLSDELNILGRDNICQIHCTNDDGVWLENDKKIDMPRVRQTLDDMGWSGWLVIERSRDQKDPKNVKFNFGANAAYLKSIFQTPNDDKNFTSVKHREPPLIARVVRGRLHIHTSNRPNTGTVIQIRNLQGKTLRSWERLPSHDGAPVILDPQLRRGAYLLRLKAGRFTQEKMFHWW